jgi:hypothetical protein
MIKTIKNKSIKWWVGRSSCITLFLIIIIFGYAKISFILRGVEIKATLEEGSSPSLVQINGNAKNAIQLVLNGREIFIDKNGNFSETVGLLPGFSVITLSAEDKFGKNAEKKFNLVYNESAEAIALGDQIIR